MIGLLDDFATDGSGNLSAKWKPDEMEVSIARIEKFEQTSGNVISELVGILQ